MIGFALALQVIAVTGVTQGVDTATYSSSSVRAFVLEATRLNHIVPSKLGKYTAQLESEISIGNQNGAGYEMAVGLEQVASELSWKRTGEFEQHVVGYRQQAMGMQFATLGFFRNAWAVPSLYGNRLALLFGRDTAQRRIGGGNNDRRTTFAVHPLSDDREKYYRYTGGDTIQLLKVGDRTIRIVRVDVVPRGRLPARSVVFSGEMDLDADRKHIVRLRGAFSVAGDEPQGPLGGLLKATRLEGIAYVELVNSEVEQQFWLPSYQRFEAQAMAPVIGDAKAVFRIVSRFRNYEIVPPEAVQLAATDSLGARPHVISIAPRDSLGAYDKWRENIGVATATSRADDFQDVAPTKWRGEGAPIVALQTERVTDIAHFNRVEGFWLGAGVTARLRDLAPGVTVRLLGGVALNERTVRGRIAIEKQERLWSYALRAGRVMDNTNDFRNQFDSSGSIGALFGRDNYDYVSRGFALASATRNLGEGESRLIIESGWMRDENTVNTLTRTPLSSKADPYLPNRGILAGDYLRTQLVWQWHPDANAEFMRPGFGAQVRYVRGDGNVKFQRVELRLNDRQNFGRWTFASRFDAGALLGEDVPPQQMFEMGRENGLAGYEYKEFAGTRAVLLRSVLLYNTGLWQAPIRVTSRIWLPAISPALAVSVQSGWTDIDKNSIAQQIGLNSLTPVACPAFALCAKSPFASTVTGNARTSVAFGLRFFGGAFGVNLARPVDHNAPWRVQGQFGKVF